ncbi:MAG: hypothetical protein KAT94_04125 [Candidatus Aenigmarchaeota archaeon]|nr:hypothetical protein [Candidatus Aenigmarchaeota archaeon]MCK4532032.1 hypothetical protein [Candidatus Aenigmarchaeota archaeon]
MRKTRIINGYVTNITSGYKIPLLLIPFSVGPYWDGEIYKCLKLTIRTKNGKGRINLKGKEEKIRLYADENNPLNNLREDFKKNALLMVKGTFSKEPYLLGRDKKWEGSISVTDENRNLLGKYKFETHECWTQSGGTKLRWIGYMKSLSKSPSFSEA